MGCNAAPRARAASNGARLGFGGKESEIDDACHGERSGDGAQELLEVDHLLRSSGNLTDLEITAIVGAR